jgi:hypothetical protein
MAGGAGYGNPQFAGKGGLIEGIKKGASTGELSTRAASGYERQAAMMADTGRFGGDTSGLMTGGFGQAQQFRTKSEELKKAAKEKGYGDDVTAYIEAEQKAKKETKDKTTVKNAQVAQLQQETATIIDNTAFSMMKTDPLCHNTAQCFAVVRHHYSKCGVVLESFFQSCHNACCDSYRRSAMPLYDDVNLGHIALCIFYRPIIRSDSFGMDAHPVLQ